MSEHHQFLCPRDMHLPPPDWRALEARLLEGGYVLEPRGDRIPYRALLNLSFGLAGLNEGSYQHRDGLRTTGDVIAMYVQAGHLPADLPIRHNDTMEEALALLSQRGIVPGDLYLDNEGSDWNSPQYCLGPAARPYLNADTRAAYDADPRYFPLMLLAYDGPAPHVAVGENLSEPSLPGPTNCWNPCRRSTRTSTSSAPPTKTRPRNGIARRMAATTESWNWTGNTAWRWAFA